MEIQHKNVLYHHGTSTESQYRHSGTSTPVQLQIHRSERQQDKEGHKKYVSVVKLHVSKASKTILVSVVSRQNCEPSKLRLQFPRESSVFHEEALRLVEEADELNRTNELNRPASGLRGPYSVSKSY